MRRIPPGTPSVVGLALCAFLAGCAELEDGIQSGDTRPCPSTQDVATLKATRGSSLEVTLPDGQPAVLHVGDAAFHRRDADGCVAIRQGELTVGSTIGFNAGAWAESYPMQAWPKEIVLDPRQMAGA